MGLPYAGSLNRKLVFASAFILALMLGALVFNGTRVAREFLLDQAQRDLKVLLPLLNTSLAASLAQRDLATLQETVTQVQSQENLEYLVILDRGGKWLAAMGWPRGRPLPATERSLEESLDQEDRRRFDGEIPIEIAGQTYGTLRFGLSTEFLKSAQRQIALQNFAITGIALSVAILLVWATGLWLTRHLRRLGEAGRALSRGDYGVRVEVTSSDEVGQLAQAFNAMAEEIQRRMLRLQESEAKFHAIANYSYDVEVWINSEGRLTWISPSVQALTGFTPQECLEMPNFPEPFIPPERAEEVMEAFRLSLNGGSGEGLEIAMRRKDGSTVPVEMNWRPVFVQGNQYKGVRASMRDATRRKEAEQALRSTIQDLERARTAERAYLIQAQDERARLSALLSAMNIGILFVGPDNRVVYHNPAFEQIWMLNATNTPFVGRDAAEVLGYSRNVLAQPDHFSKHILQVVEAHEVSDSVEIQLVDGRIIMQICYPVRDSESRLVGRLWIYEDVTRERQTAEQLIYLAERDALTGLHNRHRFQEELHRMLAEAERHKTRVALLFFDLDEFKYVNDTFGHRAGDTMLVRVAGEVGAQVRRSETLARLGGDEFAILAPEATDEEAQVLAERIVRAISRIPFQFEGHNLRLTSSMGIAVFPDHAVNSEDLVAHADAAMYQAKEAGKNTWRMYREERDPSRRMVARLSWNDRIEQALEQELFRLHFQGVYSARQASLMHLEALVRMADPDRPNHPIMPSHFIPVAEKTGKILDIDRWVISGAIACLSRGETLPALAVNISGRSFDDPTLPQFIAEQLRHWGVAPQRLLVELTETSAVGDLHDAQRFIEALRITGCRVCLDDFGAGFSSFAYLKHLQVDILKIDGQFIRDLPHDRGNQLFVKAIVDVARGLRKITVAECVEDEATLELLRRFGVDCVQGYHLEMPMEDHPALKL